MPSELPAEGIVLLTFWMGVSLLASLSALPDDPQMVPSTYIWRLTDNCNSSGIWCPLWLTKAPANYGIYAYIQAYAHSHKRISKTFLKNVCTYKCLVQDEKQWARHTKFFWTDYNNKNTVKHGHYKKECKIISYILYDKSTISLRLV